MGYFFLLKLHVHYTICHPVKAGLVYDPKDWKWGSYNFCVNNPTQDSITDFHDFFTETENIPQMQEYFKNLVLERRKEIIINFLFEQGFIPENTIVASKEKVLELLELYQRIQSKKWSDSIYKRRTPEEFL